MSNKKIHYAWWIMVGCMALLIATTGMVVNTIGVFMAPVSEALHVGIGAMVLFMTTINIGQIICMPFAGKIMSKFDTRKVLSIAILGICLSLASLSQATSIVFFYICGIIIGLCGAITMQVSAPVLVNNWFKQKSGTALGIIMASAGLGGAIFSPILTQLIIDIGWRPTYIILAAAIALITLPFTIFVLHGKPSEKGLRAYGEEAGAGSDAKSAAELPGIPFGQAIKSASFYLVCIFAGLFALLSGMYVNLVVFGASVGYPPLASASVLSVAMIGMLIGKLSLGIVNDRFGAVTTVVFANICGLIAVACLLNAGINIGVFMAGSFLYGFAFAQAIVAAPLLVRNIFGPKDYTLIYPYVAMATSMFGAVSSPIYGFIYDATKKLNKIEYQEVNF